MLMKFCARCKSMINQGRAYCEECQIEINKTKTEYKKINKAKYDKKYDLIKRDLITDKFYHSTKWKTLRAVKLSQGNYLCEDCKKKNKITIAVDVHHIIPIKKDWSKRLDINNLKCLCVECHNLRHDRFKRKTIPVINLESD